jgi:hypothetical protein
MSVLASIAFAFANLVHPRMLWLMLWPVLISIVLWSAVAIVFWTQFVTWLGGVLSGWLSTATFFVSWDPSTAALVAAKILTLLAIVPLVQLTAVLILGLFGMPAMVEHVARRSFAELERRRGGGFAGSAWNGVVSLLGLLGLGLLSLPLWLIPPLWPVLPVAIFGWVNQRVLRYDALAEHADAEEMRSIFRERRGRLYLLGVLLALIAYVPVLGLFAPVVFGLAFIHYLLGALRAQRGVAA